MLRFVGGLAILILITGQAVCVAASGRTANEAVVRPLRVITEEDTSGISTQVNESPSSGLRSQPSTERRKPCPHCRRARIGVGVDGGFAAGYLFANLDEINRHVRRMGIDEISEHLFLVGGKGYGRFGSFILGGGGYTSTGESSGIPDGCARYAQIEIAYGGVIFGLTRQRKAYEVTGGILLGGGSITVERRRNSQYVFGWNDAWKVFDLTDPDSISVKDLNVSSRLTANFIAIEPFIEIKYHLVPLVALEISASYLRARTGYGQWKLDDIKIPDSPATNVGGASLRFGLHFGV